MKRLDTNRHAIVVSVLVTFAWGCSGRVAYEDAEAASRDGKHPIANRSQSPIMFGAAE